MNTQVQEALIVCVCIHKSIIGPAFYTHIQHNLINSCMVNTYVWKGPLLLVIQGEFGAGNSLQAEKKTGG